MSQDLVNWIEEIQALQAKVAQLQTECDQANASAAHWRNLYTEESRQRRREMRLSQDKIEGLTEELQQLKIQPSSVKINSPEAIAALKKEVQQELSELRTVKQLKQKLIELIKEREQALRAWKLEKVKHRQTRDSLTTVLGDTVSNLVQQGTFTR